MSRKKKLQQDENPAIVIAGARTHNLKNFSCEIPSGKLTVVTGVSGSGKSSLAFDTLFAEGQRRYVESLSTYARQFIARMPRPDVDQIDHVPPAIALEQRNSVKNARSTIGTATEINDYLRLLFAKAGEIICPSTGEAVRRDSPETAVQQLLARYDGARAYLIAPIKLEKKSLLKATLGELQRQGFTRLFLDGTVVEIDQPDFKAPKGLDTLAVVVDRLVVGNGSRSRLIDAIESAYRVAGGRCVVQLAPKEGPAPAPLLYSEELRCQSCPGNCGHAFKEPTPQLLNFSSPIGACPTCQGFGRVTGVDWEKVIPDPTASLGGGAIAPFSGDAGQECLNDLRRLARKLDIRMNVPWQELTEREKRIVLHGEGEWYGVQGFFDYLEERRYKVQARVMIARYRGYTRCPDCHGHRIRKEGLAVRLGGKNLGEVCDMSVKNLVAWFDTLELSEEQRAIAERPLAEVRARLSYLMDVGLGYLTLSRQTRTLSGGESQRINLSTALGSALTDTLYVLDEPTVGLHARDTDRLVAVLERLRDLGNTLVVVEHDPDVIERADYLIDIGPKAGERGGELLYQGPIDGLAQAPNSLTAHYLTGGERTTAKRQVGRKRRVPHQWIEVLGARENNLRDLDVRLPLGVLCCVTGVSGSGKSTLIKSCLYNNYLRQAKADISVEPGQITALRGLQQIDDIILVDQSPIGRSSRSNPATYLKAYDHIRDLLASTPDAQALGLKPRDFSFNVPGGRCEACEGTGYQTIDMHFLADVSVVCDVCEGQRFKDHILTVKWKDHTISSILDLTIDEACVVFEDHRKILAGLEPLSDVGLGYLRLGQSTATLSGGEAQRLKLASHLAETKARQNLLLLFDEPTTGLHPADLDVLIRVFHRLVERGFSLIVIEHNSQLIAEADHVVDLGPEGGEEGGRLVAQGTPEEIALVPDSITGRYLAMTITPGGKAPSPHEQKVSC